MVLPLIGAAVGAIGGAVGGAVTAATRKRGKEYKTQYNGLGKDYFRKEIEGTPDASYGVDASVGNEGLDGYRQANAQGMQQTQQARAQQLLALEQLRGAAMGQGPSVAELQMQQGMQDAAAQQYAMAASARGGAGAFAAAQRQAAAAGVNMMGQTAGQSAMLRAQEMAQARGQYASAADSLRGQDASYQNMMAQNAMALRGQDFGFANANADRAQRGRQIYDQYRQQMLAMSQDSSRMDYQAQRDWANDNYALDADLAGRQRDAMNTGLRVGAGLASSAMGGAGGGGSAASGGGATPPPGGTSDGRKKENMRDANTGARRITDAEAARLSGEADRMFADIPRKVSDREAAALSARADAMFPGYEVSASRADDIDRSYQAAFADTRTQDMMRAAAARQGPSAQMLDRVQPVEYNYTPDADESQLPRRYGVVAQDLARSDMGRSLLMPSPNGIKVDTNQATLANTAALADMHARMKALEEERTPASRISEAQARMLEARARKMFPNTYR